MRFPRRRQPQRPRRREPEKPREVVFFGEVCERFKIPVCYVPLRIGRFDGVELPWSYRAVNN